MTVSELIKKVWDGFVKILPWFKWVLIGAGVLLVVKILFFDIKIQGFLELSALKKKTAEVYKKITDLDGEKEVLAKENEQLKLKEKTTQWQYSQMKSTYEKESKKAAEQRTINSTNVLPDPEIERQLRLLEATLQNGGGGP